MAAPDIIVAVDFGTTYTGVAWVRCDRPAAPIQVIRDWPHSEDDDERKVPSLITYNSRGKVSSWGFSCAHDRAAGQAEPWSFFKLYIDRKTFDRAQASGKASGKGYKVPQTHRHALQIATDYLREVRRHVQETVSAQIGVGKPWGPAPSWLDLRVSFIFSVPTTWATVKVLEDFKGCIAGAGFGGDGYPAHTATIDLTEAEAASVAVLKNSVVGFGVGDLLLCIDAGGGTTDLALGRVSSADPDCPQMEQVTAVCGLGTGSTMIDKDFQQLVQSRIDACGDAHGIPDLLPDCARRMASSQYFRTVKHNFGKKAWQPPYRVRVEELGADANLPQLGVENGNMVFSAEEMRSLFDPHVANIVQKAKGHLDWLTNQGDFSVLRYIILSGGLGRSEYVRAQLRQQLEQSPHPRAEGAGILLCEDPQLVVVRGLLFDRQQAARRKPVLAGRIARASYGIVVKEPYDPEIHRHIILDEDLVTDPLDGKKYASNQIKWLIRKGERVDSSVPIRHQLAMGVAKNEPALAWQFELVQSGSDGPLPGSTRDGIAVKLCDLQSDLSGIQQTKLVVKKTRGTLFRRGKKYLLCEFDIVVTVAPADLKFELQVGGERFSGNHKPITIKWDPAGIAASTDTYEFE
ncbi:hypothetical protein RB595_004255 [Gaeumannomyces hyphopodioides]